MGGMVFFYDSMVFETRQGERFFVFLLLRGVILLCDAVEQCKRESAPGRAGK